MSRKQEDLRCIQLGQNIKRLREKKGWTQEELAEKAELHISYIGQIERGLRYPSLRVLFKISDALGVKNSELFKGLNVKKTK